MKSCRTDSISPRKNRAVSEVIGTMFIFAIFISLLTTVVAWYIPASQTSAEQSYQANTLTSMSSLSSSLSDSNLQVGSVLNQNFPLGIKGSYFLPANPTSLSYTPGASSGSVNYGIGLGFKYLDEHPTSSVLNKIVGTYPIQGSSDISAIIFVSPYLYVAGYQSNNIAVIDVANGQLVKYIYAGAQPNGMVYDPVDNLIFVSDNYTYVSSVAHFSYSTISVISVATNSFLGTIYGNSTTQSYFSAPTAITYGNGYVYVSSRNPTIAQPRGNITAFSATTWKYYMSNTSFNFYPTAMQFVNQQIGAQIYGTLVTLDNRSSGAPSFSELWSSNITVFVNHNIVDNKLKLNSASLNGFYVNQSATMFVSFNNGGGSKSNVNGLLDLELNATLTGGKGYYNVHPIGYYTFSGSLIPTNLTYIPSLNQVVVVVKDPGSTTTDQVNSFNVVASNKGNKISVTFNPVAQTLVRKTVQDIVATTNSASESIVFVSDSYLDEETQISVTSSALSITKTILNNYYQNPVDAAYDPYNNYLYVSNYGSGTVSVINPINTTTRSLVGTIALGQFSFPTKLAVNGTSGLVYVLETGTDSVAVIQNLTTYKVNGVPAVIPLAYTPSGSTTTVRFTPYDIAYDNSTHTPYVTANNGTTGAVFNITSVANAAPVLVHLKAKIQGIAFSSHSNETYAVAYLNSRFYIVEISSSTVRALPLQQTDSAGSYSITFDPYNGYMFAAFALPNAYGTIEIYTNDFALFTSFTTGYEPIGPAFDAGNNLVYVPNYGQQKASNVTVIDASTFSVLTTIWIGDGAQNACYDPNNGYIYIPDNVTQKLSVIDGGFTIFQGRPGVLISNSINIGGEISSSGHTNFISQVGYTNDAGILVRNYTGTGASKVVGSSPLVITKQNGNNYFSASFAKFISPGTATVRSMSSTSPTVMQLQLLNKVNPQYYIGDHFYISDLYGNNYVAVVTNIYLEYFNMHLVTPFAKVINSYLYSAYNGTAATAPSSWHFAGSAFQVSVTGNSIYISMTGTMTVSSASILYYEVGLNTL